MHFGENFERIDIKIMIELEIVKSIGPSISKLLLNNSVNKPSPTKLSCWGSCTIFSKQLRINSNVMSPTKSRSYFINPNLNCSNSGIHFISCSCSSHYIDKTTSFSRRFNEHFSSPSAVFEHNQSCLLGRKRKTFQFNI